MGKMEPLSELAAPPILKQDPAEGSSEIGLSPSLGFIRYYAKGKKIPQVQYGTFCHAERRKNRNKTNNDVWLGKVIDKELGIFYNKARKYFKFTIKNKFESLTSSEIDYFCLLNSSTQLKSLQHAIQFGDIYIINTAIQRSDIYNIIKQSINVDIDTLFTLLLFKITNNKASKFVESWWNETFIKYIYPNAIVKSQRISEFLIQLGKEENYRKFFSNYISYINKNNSGTNILIDSTGLPNDIKFDLTKISNHNGVKSNEVRLIVISEKNTGYPIYFKYLPGNFVDVSTLRNIINELDQYKINISNAILDAGYYSEGNLKALFESKIPFMIRLCSNRSIYKDLLQNYSSDLETLKYNIEYSGRQLFIKMVPYKYLNHNIYAYLAIDIKERLYQQLHIYENRDKFDNEDKISEKLKRCGFFIILSTEHIENSNLLPCYYSRQTIEQIFDYAKNDLDLLPLRIHNEETFRGHLFLCFLSTILFIYLNNILREKKQSLSAVIDSLSRFNCQIYPNNIIPNCPSKIVNDVAKCFNIKIPEIIKIQ
jgi:transposase